MASQDHRSDGLESRQGQRPHHAEGRGRAPTGCQARGIQQTAARLKDAPSKARSSPYQLVGESVRLITCQRLDSLENAVQAPQEKNKRDEQRSNTRDNDKRVKAILSLSHVCSLNGCGAQHTHRFASVSMHGYVHRARQQYVHKMTPFGRGCSALLKHPPEYRRRLCKPMRVSIPLPSP